MSYDDALEQLRSTAAAPPSFTEVEQRRRWQADRALPRRRGQLAILASCVAAAGYLALVVRPTISFTDIAQLWRSSIAALVPALALLWSVRLVRIDRVGPQMLARAIWWSNLVVGMLIAGSFAAGIDRAFGVGVAVACAVALLAAGDRGLATERTGPFQPARFRGHLLLALVMAFADAQTLLFSAVMQLRIGMQGWTLVGTLTYAGPAMVAAALMVLTVWGLYRLRTWALFVNLMANFAIAYFALEGALNVSLPVAAALSATAACQAFLPVPILASALGDRKAGQSLLRGHAAKLLNASIIAIAIAAFFQATMVRNPSGWLLGPGRAFERGAAIRPVRADLSNLQLGGIEIPADVWFRDAQMHGVRLRGAHGVAVFRGADLSEADLSETRFAGSDFHGTNLADADLTASECTGCDFGYAKLTRARLEDAVFDYTELRYARFDDARLAGASFRGARMVPMHPRNAAIVNWGDAICPDGTRADASRGCIGHEGLLPAAERMRYDEIMVQRTDADWTEREGCWQGKAVQRVRAGDFLRFLGAEHIRTDASTFISRHGTVRVDASAPAVKFRFEHTSCGWLEFTQVLAPSEP